jgi:hypothetical protein
MMSELKNSLMCQSNEVSSNYYFIVIFFISFFCFKFILNKQSNLITIEERSRKSKKAEKYFNKYEQENKEFFFVEY